jgi:hypothetical protein
VFDALRERFANWIRPRRPETIRTFGDEPMKKAPPEGPTQLRRWDSADTTRLNAEQWCQVQATSINADIESQLETLIARCRYERKNNPMVEGVIKSYCKFVVGKGGPTLIVESSSDDYNRTFRQIWDGYWSRVTVDGMHGVDLLKRLVGQTFDAGNWLQQLVNFDRWLPSSEPVKTRLLDVDPIRLATPPGKIGSRNIVAGIERNSFGIPTTYFVRNPRDQFLNPSFDWSLAFDPIPAGDILHCFHTTEPGQACGVPALASVLQECADLRDFDHQVLDAARVQANNGMLLGTDIPELVAEHAKVFTGKITLERQVAKALPVGYKAYGQTNTQPGTQYIPFRHEKLRSLGRIIDMPLLMVLLSAEESNFSQSRIDLNVLFQNEVTDEQQWIERCWLNPQVAMVARESGLAFAAGKTQRDQNPFLLPPKPADLRISWGWEPIGQANELDHVKAQDQKIRLGLTAPEIELSAEGKSEDAILDSIKRTNDKRIKRGLAPLPGPEQQQVPHENQQEQTPGGSKGIKGKGGKAAKSRLQRADRRRSARTPVHP